MTKPTKFSNLSNVFFAFARNQTSRAKFRQTSFYEIDFSGASRQEKKKCYRLCYLCYRLRQPWLIWFEKIGDFLSWFFSKINASKLKYFLLHPKKVFYGHFCPKTAWNHLKTLVLRPKYLEYGCTPFCTWKILTSFACSVLCTWKKWTKYKYMVLLYLKWKEIWSTTLVIVWSWALLFLFHKIGLSRFWTVFPRLDFEWMNLRIANKVHSGWSGCFLHNF